ncbi:MAG TPA: DUF1176 domain-containing protein [Alphaproteobacteria bacterium]|jgi:invasion protein IalB|nr:DUF1176 domain-containing protein [Alphaproteobacteria bacterium]
MAAESRKRGFGLGAVLAVCAVLASGVAWARTTVEESAGAFRDWSATCRYDSAGECVAIAYASEHKGPAVPDYILRVVRTRSDAPAFVVFSPTFHFAAGSTLLTLRVDGRPPIQFAPGDGWRHGEAPNDYTLAEPVRTQRLLAEMRAGQQVTIAYADREGRQREATFSLRGLSAALGFIEEFQAQKRAAEPIDRAPKADWARGLQGFLPAIEACRRRSAVRIEQITSVWPYDNGSLGLVAVASDGRRFVCRVRRDGSHVSEFRRPDSAESLPSEGPFFTPYGGRRPAGQCFEHFGKVDRAGQFAGWLSYDRCKRDARH